MSHARTMAAINREWGTSVPGGTLNPIRFRQSGKGLDDLLSCANPIDLTVKKQYHRPFGKTRGQAMGIPVEMVGQRFARLTVLTQFGVYRCNGRGTYQFICQCDCGTLTIAIGANLRRGNTKSCGCIQDETRRESTRAHQPLTAEYLRTRVTYDPDTGLFYWKQATKHNQWKAGEISGSRKRKIRYWMISIDGTSYLAHRLAWLYMTGEWPNGEIDHINRIREDNRWINLRLATRAQNLANIGRRRGKSTPKGVQFLKRHRGLKRPYRASIEVRGEVINLGYFATAAEAGAAYRAAASKFHGEFASQED